MLPRITPEFTINKIYQEFLSELRKTAFKGEIRTDFAARLAVATDNSIYQMIPQAVFFPKTTADISAIMILAHEERFREVKFCGRGGGTSTNGQSLTAGIIIDCSKYMREILELNTEAGWVRVQPGVVLDQLNTYLKPYQVCFAPEISPSNRATIGGMVNTDACGVGSRLLGRTSDNVVDLTCVLNDGQVIQTAEIDKNSTLYTSIASILQKNTELIQEKFTNAPRTLNGYNLKKASDLNYLICGSEGTLAMVSECKLKLTPLPKFKKVIVVKYRSLEDALRAPEFKEFKPLIIEVIDEKLIELAKQDPIYLNLKHIIDDEKNISGALNLVQFVANTEEQLEHTISQFCQVIDDHKNQPQRAFGYYIAKTVEEEKRVWELRKKSVGLLSKKKEGTRRPIPFIEDTAVPPEKLADYISDLKKLLDQYKLMYGMYGHVDAGCIHVRPALDMKLISDEKLIRELTDKVVALLEKYGGILWGEHGLGNRSEYNQRFFGELYYAVRQIKTLFDPYNQLNPGKIAIPLDSSNHLIKLDGPLRGKLDKDIPVAIVDEYAATLICNGNGACFNYATADVMCPSFKVTQDRIHSPKGRATVMREWLRQLAKKKFVFERVGHSSFLRKFIRGFRKDGDFSHEVYQAMAGCLGCKACAGQCPLNVDVPDFKSKFLFYYHRRYQRAIRDYFIAALERLAPLQSRYSRMIRWLQRRKLVLSFVNNWLKIIDPPLISSISIKRELKKRRAPKFSLPALDKLAVSQKNLSLILLQDAFTSFYEPEMILSIYDFLTKIGFSVYVAPFFASGKSYHVLGFLNKFYSIANKNHLRLQNYAKFNIPIVGIDPSVTLTYRDEYQKIFKNKYVHVHLLQEWLIKNVNQLKLTSQQTHKKYYLLSHCTEKTMCAESEKQWATLFSSFGVNLEPISVGCCGMAGAYGHEREHFNNSKKLFGMDWQRILGDNNATFLATGYSCRSQTKRFMGKKLLHPIQALATLI